MESKRRGRPSKDGGLGIDDLKQDRSYPGDQPVFAQASLQATLRDRSDWASSTGQGAVRSLLIVDSVPLRPLPDLLVRLRRMAIPEPLVFSSAISFTRCLFLQPPTSVALNLNLVVGWREAKPCALAIAAVSSGNTSRLRRDGKRRARPAMLRDTSVSPANSGCEVRQVCSGSSAGGDDFVGTCHSSASEGSGERAKSNSSSAGSLTSRADSVVIETMFVLVAEKEEAPARNWAASGASGSGASIFISRSIDDLQFFYPALNLAEEQPGPMMISL
mmetsp:Transcript_15016/g.33064  ORF Transcript_15016/g.33064 Transcript_15016/m.33064 type:complete len:275 (+) Transcript_15016:137-961(+)|eukprot:CAMPEP_0170576262 /NCGR_PEP_ID=MMETSP0224-20130122/4298_1 /TAXON_ID=285029 /ORGANISM="Togula jolla, Strain CCCM 725" /LENGTH=274 /DNA_ID=CAMNT_0010899091 /DNA_START=89 /DNA_END=913 /DNA_ORIENTATION=-